MPDCVKVPHQAFVSAYIFRKFCYVLGLVSFVNTSEMIGWEVWVFCTSQETGYVC